MIDPRFANAGVVPLVPGFGTQQMPMQYHHQTQVQSQPQSQHRRRLRKNKVRNDESPVSRDESIHKVDHGQHNFVQNNDLPLGSGYGVPYSVTAFTTSVAGAAGFHPQQQFGTANFGYANQYQSGPYGSGPVMGGSVGQSIKHHRYHRRHHRQDNSEVNTATQGDQEQATPEQLIGQRSSSARSKEEQRAPSPAPAAEDEALAEVTAQRRYRHHRHHQQNVEQINFGQTQPSRQTKCHTSAGADGYGHINDDLIFIERGDHSPHRQEPPPGFEYKGKIEVQGINREFRSRSRGSGAGITSSVPVPQSSVPVSQPIVPTPSMGPCPPGWQQMVLTAAPGGPCPPGGLSYTGHPIGGVVGVQSGLTGFGAASPFGLTSSGFNNFGAGLGGTFGSFGAGGSFPSPYQFVADYGFGANTGTTNVSRGGGYSYGYQAPNGTGFGEQLHHVQAEEHVSARPTIIEVWQRRSKSAKPEQPDSQISPGHKFHSRHGHRSHSSSADASFDFERFREDILNAIERMAPRGGSGPSEPTGRDGGTQTQINPGPGGEPRIPREKRQESSTGEVRVIVQPVQPVFYMPRQTGGTTTSAQVGPTPIGPVPIMQSQASSGGGANVVYVPRNVYVPVIKPVFVPRERVIVRPQVIHVARPVLVDRPVPVTQRPIIIDRERSIPVPVRGGGQEAAHSQDAKVIREEYVYRDNLPVAYGGRCPEFAGGVNYGYMPTQQEHQYASNSAHEASNIYQTQAPVINVNVPNQFQHSQTVSQFEGQQGINESFHEAYTNLNGGESTFAAEINNDYLAAQQEPQYTTNSTHETDNIYQNETTALNVNVQNQYQHSQMASHLSENEMVCENFEGTYSDLVGARNGTAVGIGQLNQDVLQQTLEQSAQISGVPLHCHTQIEILDTAVNPSWQKTDQSALIRRYGRPAFEIVNKSEQVEQQMYHELRQRTSSAGIIRSSSTASYGSSSGLGASGMAQY